MAAGPKKNEKKERPLGRAGPPALLFFIFFRAPGAGPAAERRQPAAERQEWIDRPLIGQE